MRLCAVGRIRDYIDGREGARQSRKRYHSICGILSVDALAFEFQDHTPLQMHPLVVVIIQVPHLFLHPPPKLLIRQ
jgi:hypothetical protein